MLWALFPFSHGLHEFDEVIIEHVITSGFIHPFLDRTEVFLATLGVIALVNASLEYTGTFPSPLGKISGLLGIAVFGFFIYTLPYWILEALKAFTFPFIMETDLFRFFHGFVLPLIASAIFLGMYLYERRRNNQLELGQDRQYKYTVTFSVITWLFLLFLKALSLLIPSLFSLDLFLLFCLLLSHLCYFKTNPGLKHLLVI